MDSIKLQVEIANEFWKLVKGNPSYSISLDAEETKNVDKLHAIEELLKKGVLKRKQSFYYVCSNTKFFIDNNGKTEYDCEKEKEEYRKDESLKLAKQSNVISGIAAIISIVSIIISVYNIK